MSLKPKEPTFYQDNLDGKIQELETWIKDADSFEQYCHTFISEFQQDENLGKFTSEYNTILSIIKSSRINCVALLDKAADVVKEVKMHDYTPPDQSKIINDTTTLKTLKSQINRAEIMLGASGRREEAAKDELRQLRYDVANLQTSIKQGVGLSAAQEKAINELIALKELTTKELEQELEKIVSVRANLGTVSERIEASEIERKQIDREIYYLKEKNAAKKVEIDMELSNKEKLERDLRELRVIVTIKSQEAVQKQSAVNRVTEEIHTIENQIKEQKHQIEKLLKDQESLGTRTVKLQADYDEQMGLTQELMAENEIASQELKVKERELSNHKQEVRKVNRIRDAFIKKSRALEDEKMREENIRKVYRTENDALMASIDHKKREVESIKKVMDDLTREKDILSGSLKKTQSETSRVSSLLMLQKQQQATYELDIARMIKEVAENERDYKLLTIERDQLVAEEQDLRTQTLHMQSQLKDQELQIFDYKRQTLASENKLKYQQNLYEQVQSDRKLHSKQLIESQTEIGEMKRKLKIMNFQINGFKEDVNQKDSVLQKAAEELVKLNKDMDLIRDEIKTLKNQNDLAQAYIKTQMVEEGKLDQFVKEAENEKARQQQALDLIVSERDMLTSQLLHRNQELTKVYNNIKTQNLDLLRGEAHYRDRMKKIQATREKALKYRVCIAEIQTQTTAIPEMKKQIVKLQKQVVKEQSRIKALEQELENPINVHRWRKLEGSQPQTFAMLQLLHTLQKKLISKTKDEIEKAQAIEMKEKLYLHLKTILAKQAGPESTLQIQEFHKAIKDKSTQLRHMETELNMYKAQVNEFEFSIKDLDGGLSACKKEFLKMYQKRVCEAQELQVPQGENVDAPASDQVEEAIREEFNEFISDDRAQEEYQEEDLEQEEHEENEENDDDGKAPSVQSDSEALISNSVFMDG